MPLPKKNEFTGSNVTEQQFKNAHDQLIDFLENEVASKDVVDALSDEITREDSIFFYSSNNIAVTKYFSPDFFGVDVDVKEGDYFIINTKTHTTIAALYITNSNGNIIETMPSDLLQDQACLIKMPALATKLYVSCLKGYSQNFSCGKIAKSILDVLDKDISLKPNTYFSRALDGVVFESRGLGLFSIEHNVQKDEYYLIDTQSFGVAAEYYIVDSNNKALEKVESGEGREQPYVIKMPEFAAKLYVNCAVSYIKKFKVEKLSKTFLNMFTDSGKRQDITFYYKPAGSSKIRRESGSSGPLFCVEIDVTEGQYYSIDTVGTGPVGEYYVTDIDNNVIDEKTSSSTSTDFIIKMPKFAAKLYVNCVYEYENNFSVARVQNSIIEHLSKNEKSVRDSFPTFNYFDKLKEKCPNFYKKFKEKTGDVTVVLTGTSLTQGNLYVTDRVDSTTRPAALHTHDFASSIFDKLVKHWDGQQYRRFDHLDLVYSGSSWSVVNQLPDYVWDDYAHIKNGLTKTTTDANASVSITIPANAWQFNFVYRSDSQSGNCTVAIAEGNGKVELYNGSEWIEANSATFSMYEGPATETKGNTQYQKRLKMRCKNKTTGGINSIGSTKQITISKGDNSNRFNVVGFEWSPREHMLSVINGARGGFEWGDPNGNRLDKYQDTDIWSFNPDLLLAEITIINWGASEPTAMSVDPLHYVNIAKRAYFNEFGDMPTSLYAKSEAYTKCDVIFYSDTLSATSSVSQAWDSVTREPKFGTVVEAATNGGVVDTSNVGRVKTNFDNYEAVESYIASKNYLFIPVLSTFKDVAEKFYGGYWQGMQPSEKDGNTLTIDGGHYNDNGAALFSLLIASVFEGL